MNIGRITSSGLFDSKKFHPFLKRTKPRVVTDFEIDYILTCDKISTSFLDEDTIQLLPNMLIVRKPGQTSHSILHYKCYCIHLKVEETNPLFDKLMRLPNFFFIINKETYQTLFTDLFRHLVKKPQNKDSYYTTAKLLELIYHLEKDSKQNKKASTSQTNESHAVKTAIDFMKNNFDKKITLELLGDIVGYSPNHFRNIFSNTMNTSPQKYLEKIRIDHAKFLLAQNELSIADIAYACGFSSQAYFTSIFKQNTLLSPNEFRQVSLVKYTEG